MCDLCKEYDRPTDRHTDSSKTICHPFFEKDEGIKNDMETFIIWIKNDKKAILTNLKSNIISKFN